MQQLHFKCAAAYSCERFRYIAAYTGGYLSMDRVREICKDSGWKFGTCRKHLQKGNRLGLLTSNQRGYQFILYSDLCEKYAPKGEIIRVPVKILLTYSYKKYKQYLAAHAIKKIAIQKHEILATIKNWEAAIQRDGFYKKRILDRETGEVTYVRGYQEDVEIYRSTYASELHFEILHYKDDPNQKYIKPLALNDTSTTESEKFSVQLVEHHYVDGSGMLSNINAGGLYTQVQTNDGIDNSRIFIPNSHAKAGVNGRKYPKSTFSDFPIPFNVTADKLVTQRLYGASLSITQLAHMNHMSTATMARYIVENFGGCVTRRQTNIVVAVGMEHELAQEINGMNAGGHDTRHRVFCVKKASELKKSRNKEYSLIVPEFMQGDFDAATHLTLLKMKTQYVFACTEALRFDLPDRPKETRALYSKRKGTFA